MAKVTIRYWAAAKDAAGVAEDAVEAETLAGALEVILARRGADGRLGPVLAGSSFLVDGAPVGRRGRADLVLHDSAVVEVLPQFAGGLTSGPPARGSGGTDPPVSKDCAGRRDWGRLEDASRVYPCMYVPKSVSMGSGHGQ